MIDLRSRKKLICNEKIFFINSKNTASKSKTSQYYCIYCLSKSSPVDTSKYWTNTLVGLWCRCHMALLNNLHHISMLNLCFFLFDDIIQTFKNKKRNAKTYYTSMICTTNSMQPNKNKIPICNSGPSLCDTRSSYNTSRQSYFALCIWMTTR